MASLLKTSYSNRQRTLLQVRSGYGTTPLMEKAIRALDEHSPVDIHTITIDSYTRLGLSRELAELRRAGRLASLNGYPITLAASSDLRCLREASGEKPLQVRHGSPYPLDIWHASKNIVDSFEGGPLGYSLPYAYDTSIERSLSEWSRINREVVADYDGDIVLERELFGSYSSVLIAPEIQIFLLLIEAKLAVDDGLAFITLGLPQSGSPEQDIAAIEVARRLSRELLGPNIHVAIASYHWMGVFPRSEAGANALIYDQSMVAGYCRAEKVLIKTTVEGFRVPSISDNIAATKISLLGVEQGKAGGGWDLARIRLHADAAYTSLSRLLDSVSFDSLNEANVVDHLKSGRIDIPYASHKLCRNRVRCARDPSGNVRVVEPGNMAFDAEACKYVSSMCGASKSPRDALERAIRDLNYMQEKYDEPGKCKELAC